jgi:alpha-glucosidase (family GH31 glycosyl hydrolase)
MIGESLLATPLYGEDYATAETRDVYLPRGKWIDYDTGKVYQGATTLKNFALPIGKTPLFVGGKGVVVEATDGTRDDKLVATVYPIATRGSLYTFTYRDAQTTSRIVNDNAGWNGKTLVVTDETAKRNVPFKYDARTGAFTFELAHGHHYRLSKGN